MLPHLRRRRGFPGRFLAIGLAVAATVASVSCDKMPLLAPTGSVITLFAGSKVMAVNGTIEIVATVIEQGAAAGAGGGTSAGGQPVQNGTLVTFTTTIGTIDPREARTHNGQVSVRLTGSGVSGVAKVLAFSGGAKSAELEISVGAAAAKRVILTASPSTIPSSGGAVEIAARVEDESGNGLPGVPVTFSASAGTLSSPTAMTDESGVARTTLMTGVASDVTASVGSVAAVTIKLALSPRSGIGIALTGTAPTAGSPATFSVTVSTTANVRDVTVNWGDGSSSTLGAISAASTSVTHTFAREGTYTVTATALDATGNRESVSTSVTVLQPAPIGVTLTTSPASPTASQTVTFTAAATPPSGSAISRYEWTFGDGSTTTTSGGSASHVYSSAGSYTVTVRVVATNGSTGTGQAIVNVAAVSVKLTSSPAAVTHGVTVVTFTAEVTGAVVARYDWDFGNGDAASGTSSTRDYVYPAAGTFTATVTVVLSNGATAVGQRIVVVS